MRIGGGVILLGGIGVYLQLSARQANVRVVYQYFLINPNLTLIRYLLLQYS